MAQAAVGQLKLRAGGDASPLRRSAFGLDLAAFKKFNVGIPIIFATIATGIAAGLSGVGFHYMADWLAQQLFAWDANHQTWVSLPYVLGVPTLGLGLIGVILHYYPEGRVGGVVEVLDDLHRAGGVIPFRRIVNVILSALVLGFGGSVGPEGPMVQMGALLGSLIGRKAGLKDNQLDALVRAGTAAGIASAFRSAAGGVLLSVETFGARFDQTLAVIGIASVVGYLTRIAVLGDAYPFRPRVNVEPLSPGALFLIVPLMGLVAAPTGHFFIWLFNRFKTVFPDRWPLPLRLAVGGLLVGTIGIWYPQVMSAGYGVIVHGVQGGITFKLFVILLLLKMLATCITFSSGAVGGLFAPTLVIGAMYGGAWGYGLHYLMPHAVPQPELFVLLGMVVMFGSIVKGYWSGLLMVADMSGCYHQLLPPGVIAGGISFIVSWELHDKSIFGLRLLGQGSADTPPKDTGITPPQERSAGAGAD